MSGPNFNISGQVYRKAQRVPVDKCCNGWTVINKSDVEITVNGIPLKPFPAGHPELSGESFGVVGNIGEIYTGFIDIAFLTNPTTYKDVVVIQKTYV
jgi:hypothetical protein